MVARTPTGRPKLEARVVTEDERAGLGRYKARARTSLERAFGLSQARSRTGCTGTSRAARRRNYSARSSSTSRSERCRRHRAASEGAFQHASMPRDACGGAFGPLSGRFIDPKGRGARLGRPWSSMRRTPWHPCSMRSLVGFAVSDVVGALLGVQSCNRTIGATLSPSPTGTPIVRGSRSSCRRPAPRARPDAMSTVRSRRPHRSRRPSCARLAPGSERSTGSRS